MHMEQHHRLNGLARLIMATSGRSLRGVGRMLGISRSRATRIISGQRRVSGEHLKILSNCLHCSAHLLVAPASSAIGLAGLYAAWATLQVANVLQGDAGSESLDYMPRHDRRSHHPQ